MDVSASVRRLDRLWTALETHAAEMPDNDPSNCFLWAMRQRARQGGAVIVQPSAYGPFHHVQWLSPSGEVWEFDPLDEKYQRSDIPTLFEGRPIRVRSGEGRD